MLFSELGDKEHYGVVASGTRVVETQSGGQKVTIALRANKQPLTAIIRRIIDRVPLYRSDRNLYQW